MTAPSESPEQVPGTDNSRQGNIRPGAGHGSVPSDRVKPELIAAFIFGVLFISIVLIIALFVPNPQPFPYLVFRVVLALSAAGVAAMIPGIFEMELKSKAAEVSVKAAGALAIFAAVFFLNPAQLAVRNIDNEKTKQEVRGRINRFQKEVGILASDVAVFSESVSKNPEAQDTLYEPVRESFKRAHARCGIFIIGRTAIPDMWAAYAEPTDLGIEFQDMDFLTVINQHWRLTNPDTPIDVPSKDLLSKGQKFVVALNVGASDMVLRIPSGRGIGNPPRDQMSPSEKAAIISKNLRKEIQTIQQALNEIKDQELVRPILVESK